MLPEPEGPPLVLPCDERLEPFLNCTGVSPGSTLKVRKQRLRAVAVVAVLSITLLHHIDTGNAAKYCSSA